MLILQLSICMVVECKEVSELISHFKFVDQITAFVDNVQQAHPGLSNAIGVHLRAG